MGFSYNIADYLALNFTEIKQHFFSRDIYNL